jgi:signal transduction histidine kinase
MPRSSISLRLVLGASLWIAGALAATGILLTGLFRNHIESQTDAHLRDHAEELLVLSDVDATGQVYLKRHPVDPRFNKPFSGHYWQIRVSGRSVERSRSLMDREFPEPAVWPGDTPAIYAVTGPKSERLRVFGQMVAPYGSNRAFLVLVASPAAEHEEAVYKFVSIIIGSLTLLGLGLVGAVVIQVRYGLKPLRRMSATLSDIRAGRATRIEAPSPPEIAPLVDELNALLDHNATVIERARRETSNLAHALKTPLAVLRNEAGRIDGEIGEVVSQQAALMNTQIGHHLSRARAAGAHRILGARTEVHPVIERLCTMLRRIFEDRHIDIAFDMTDGLFFQGEHHDLEEMLGNLMENGCKWSRRQVRVHGMRKNDEISLVIEDDGPGIPEDLRSEVLDRGRRLDETTPGSGLGLSIVLHTAELYGGSLTLEASPLGGLAAILRLPAA